MNVFDTNTGYRFIEVALNFLHKKSKTDWEERRYEIAKDIMAHSAQWSNHSDYFYTCTAQEACKAADDLIEELKKVKQ